MGLPGRKRKNTPTKISLEKIERDKAINPETGKAFKFEPIIQTRHAKAVQDGTAGVSETAPKPRAASPDITPKNIPQAKKDKTWQSQGRVPVPVDAVAYYEKKFNCTVSYKSDSGKAKNSKDNVKHVSARNAKATNAKATKPAQVFKFIVPDFDGIVKSPDSNSETRSPAKSQLKTNNSTEAVQDSDDEGVDTSGQDGSPDTTSDWTESTPAAQKPQPMSQCGGVGDSRPQLMVKNVSLSKNIGRGCSVVIEKMSTAMQGDGRGKQGDPSVPHKTQLPSASASAMMSQPNLPASRSQPLPSTSPVSPVKVISKDSKVVWRYCAKTAQMMGKVDSPRLTTFVAEGTHGLHSPQYIVQNNTTAVQSLRKAFASLPGGLMLGVTAPEHGLSVITRDSVKMFTQFGPLEGVPVADHLILPKTDLRHVWIIEDRKTKMDPHDRHFISTSSEDESNWCRYLRYNEINPNLEAVVQDGRLYFVSTRDIEPLEELTFFQNIPLPKEDSPADSVQYTGDSSGHIVCVGCDGNKALYPANQYWPYLKHVSVFHPVTLAYKRRFCTRCGAVMRSADEFKRHQKSHSR
ncbi:uncharacterized protein LOC106155486 [Lingula anatina]|uniref:Uncharacterized protein LOC106155486 n=1 Tax=Lingula anatina TaxID=7574 RepID=A0A1S3HIH9_LINAN|nr:uncharacterized protein LOC106155486 [Lingula anatina]XP_023933240.1 uncharacterized protein LOC106155486 [Lingula anatina]|eukprot:XP_013385817.1 uncharacterized protein LOC106155486 [Lingula anatina]